MNYGLLPRGVMARFLPVSGTPVSMTWSMVEINLVFLEVYRLPPPLDSIILLVSSWGLLWVKGGLPFGWNELFKDRLLEYVDCLFMGSFDVDLFPPKAVSADTED